MNHTLVSEYFNEIYKDLCEGLINEPEYESATKDGNTIYEFINKSFELTNPKNCFATCRNMSVNYLNGELDWYLSGSPLTKDIARYSKFWETISDDGWSANSNYGKLLLFDRNLHNYTQFEYAKSCLINNKDSKKAVMIIYNKDHSFKSKDNPCTLSLQFFIRNDKLSLYTKMRSSDIFFGQPYDIPFFCLIQYMMYFQLRNTYRELTIGSYHHNSGSLHLYDRNKKYIQQCIKEYSKDTFEKSQRELFNSTILRRITQWRKSQES